MSIDNEQFHNPQNLDSPGEGHTFIPKGDKFQDGDQCWGFPTKLWTSSMLNPGDDLDIRITYRRKLTEPKEIDYSSRENKIAVFTAYLDGKEWQVRTKGTTEWRTYRDAMPMFGDVNDYRVKPPEPTRREGIVLDWSKLPKEAMWVAITPQNNLLWFINKPSIVLLGWHNGVSAFWVTNNFPFTYSGDWKDSLTPRPEQRKEEEPRIKLVPLNCSHDWDKRNELPCPKCLQAFKDAARATPIPLEDASLAQAFEIGHATGMKEAKRKECPNCGGKGWNEKGQWFNPPTQEVCEECEGGTKPRPEEKPLTHALGMMELAKSAFGNTTQDEGQGVDDMTEEVPPSIGGMPQTFRQRIFQLEQAKAKLQSERDSLLEFINIWHKKSISLYGFDINQFRREAKAFIETAIKNAEENK